MTEDRDPAVDRGLEALAGHEGPEIPEALERELAALAPVKPRAPRRELLVLVALSLLYAAGIVGVLGVRRDLAALPTGWTVAYGAMWLFAFVAIAYLVVVPKRGAVMPRVRLAGWIAAIAAVGLIGFGFFGAREASHATPLACLRRGHACLEIGLVTAAAPLALALLVLRGTLPVGSRRAALAIGAAAGSLGGLALHFHCPVGDRWHLGLVHGGVVLLAAGLAGLAAFVRTRS
jgi:hypothetical protein